MGHTVSVAEEPKQSYTLAHGGRLQERYHIVSRLGAGGMGAVYEAVDERLQITVAIKETFAVDGRLRRQFEQEARLLAQLDHPALPRVSDYFTEDGRAFLVMQFIAGNDLAQIIAEQPGPLPRAQVIVWADQLLDALVYLHTRQRQIIHRDIKPHNLKLTASGQIALLDFGLAKAHSGDQTTTHSSHSIFGYTRRYSPLEQIQDQGTSPQSDIYALGATLYHLLTGVEPPDALARAAALANSKPDPLLPAYDLHSVVGPALSAVLNTALALDSSGRFQTAKEFREALRGMGRSTLPSNPIDRSTSSLSDPFDAYSILKPADMSWSAPNRSWSIPSVICGGGVLAVLAFIGLSLVSSVPNVERAVTDSVKATATKNPVAGANARESKSDHIRPIAGASPTPAPTRELDRGTDRRRRTDKRSQPGPRTPPVPSVRPALSLPSQ